MQAASQSVRPAITAGNRRYEERFGHVFLIAAAGRRPAGDPERVDPAAGQQSRGRAARRRGRAQADHPPQARKGRSDDSRVPIARRRPVGPRARRRSSPPRRWRSWPTCSGSSAPAATRCWPPAGAPRRDRAHPTGSTSCAETRDVRERTWQVAAAPPDLVDRRVEITGPTEPKMAINALNSRRERLARRPRGRQHAALAQRRRRPGRRCTTPSAATLSFTSPGGQAIPAARGRPTLPSIVPRPRGWHLRRAAPPGRRRAGRRRARRLRALLLPQRAPSCSRRGSGPYFYLPKMESHLEARLWNDVFDLRAARRSGSRTASIRATVLIETIPAAFEMEEILLRAPATTRAGLNAGRWDYLFSIIKNFRDAGPRFVLPDRGAVTMTAPMMRAYTELLVPTCHRRGAFAIGGMAAFIPSRRDAEVNERALAKVREDKKREAGDGFDGSWVAHPDLVPVCRRSSTACSATGPTSSTGSATTCASPPSSCSTSPASPGERTEAGLRANVEVALRYLAAWLGGQRRGRHPQPDGGRRHRRDLPLADLAVDAQRRRAGHRRDRHRGAGPPDRRRGGGAGSASSRRGSTTPAGCSSRSRWPTTSPTS